MEYQTNQTGQEDFCKNCNDRKPLTGHSTPLCQECRTYFINYPIPKWLNYAMVAIALLIITIIISVPQNILTAIHISKGEEAIENHQYLTASKEFNEAYKQLPKSVIVNANLLISSAHLNDFDVFNRSFSEIADKKIEDDKLYKDAMEANSYLSSFFPADTIYMNQVLSATGSAKILDSLWLAHQEDAKTDYYSEFIMANNYYDLKEYGSSEKVLKTLESKNPQYSPALHLLASVYKITNRYDTAISYCDKLLFLNTEDISAIAQKARIELKRKNDQKAAQYTDQAMQIDSANLYSLEAKALLQHFTNNPAGYASTMLKIKDIEKDGGSAISDRISDIVTGKVNYR